MKFSFTLEGGLGDFILKYLGSPGNRLASLLKVCEIDLRMISTQKVGHQLVTGNPFFQQSGLFYGPDGMNNRLNNDISLIANLESYPKIPVPLWLDSAEEEIFLGIKRPYAVFHPRASHLTRCLSSIFNLHVMAQYIADYSGIPLLVVGNDEFGYSSHNVVNMTGRGSPRLSCKIVEHATFFVGTHSSMQCAASVYGVPSFCLGPSHLLFHAFSAPFSYDVYLKPMFCNGGVFMLFDEAPHFTTFFEYFIRNGTSLIGKKTSRRNLILSKAVIHHSLSEIKNNY